MKLLMWAIVALTQAHDPGTVLINDNNAMYGFPEAETEAYGFYGWPRPFLRQIDRAHFMGPGGLGPDQKHYSGSGGFRADFGAMGGEVDMPPGDIQRRGEHNMMYARLDNIMTGDPPPRRAMADILVIPDGESNENVEFHFDVTFPMRADKYLMCKFEFRNGTCAAPGNEIAVSAQDSFRTKITTPVDIVFEKQATEDRASGEYLINKSFEELTDIIVVMRNFTGSELGAPLSCGALAFPDKGLPRNFRFRRSARLWWPWHRYGRHINWWDDDPTDRDGSDDHFRTANGDDETAGVSGEDDNPADGVDDDGSGRPGSDDTYNFRRRKRYGDLPDYVYMPKRDYGFYGFGVSEAAMLLAILVILQNIGLFGADGM